MRSRYLRPYSVLTFVGATYVVDLDRTRVRYASDVDAITLISEFCVRGPNGANDDFVEIYNASDTAHRRRDVRRLPDMHSPPPTRSSASRSRTAR